MAPGILGRGELVARRRSAVSRGPITDRDAVDKPFHISRAAAYAVRMHEAVTCSFVGPGAR